MSGRGFCMKNDCYVRSGAEGWELQHIIQEFMQMLGTSNCMPEKNDRSSGALLYSFNSLIREWYNR